MASKLLRSAPGDTAPGREWGGVWMPLVCSGGLRSVLPSAPSVWHREAAFCSQLRSMEPKRRSFCSGSDPRLGARASPTFSSHPSVAPGVPGDMSCTGLSKEAPPGAAAPGDKLPPLSTGELSPLAGERLPSREPEGVWRWALGLRVPQRPLTHGASSVVLTGDWERYSRVSGTRAGGVALMGEGREFRLGLSGALPLGAWLKTTTHCPTLQAGWHHSSGAPWSSFSTLSGCHVQGFACMCSSQASLNSALGPPQPPRIKMVSSSMTIWGGQRRAFQTSKTSTW